MPPRSIGVRGCSVSTPRGEVHAVLAVFPSSRWTRSDLRNGGFQHRANFYVCRDAELRLDPRRRLGVADETMRERRTPPAALCTADSRCRMTCRRPGAVCERARSRCRSTSMVREHARSTTRRTQMVRERARSTCRRTEMVHEHVRSTCRRPEMVRAHLVMTFQRPELVCETVDQLRRPADQRCCRAGKACRPAGWALRAAEMVLRPRPQRRRSSGWPVLVEWSAGACVRTRR
jgi:hypothetical protein